jgi:hypothetical protein
MTKQYMKKIQCIFSAALLFVAAGCEGFLDRESESILSDEQVFSDENMIKSVLANLYGRVDWGQSIDNSDAYMETDEAANSGSGGWRWSSNGGGYNDDIFRVYDYRLIRDINEFLVGVRSDAAANLNATTRNQLEGEVRFIRAWTYFNMGRCMGGMPIVGDEVFEYSAGGDITALQVPRSTEAGIYDYVIKECTEIALLLPETPSTNAARATKWAALTLKARSAIYAASIAKYGSSFTDIRTSDYNDTDGGAVGIPASKAESYYRTALAAAQEVAAGGRYGLYEGNPDKGVNFYEAVCKKGGNNEVIWAQDHFVPSEVGRTGFTNANGPLSQANDADANRETVILNLVEAFEYTDNRDGTLKTRTTDGKDYIYYEKPEDLFANKDPRLYGSVVYSGADWNGNTIIYQSGQKKWNDTTSVWTTVGAGSDVGTKDDDGDMLVSIDGPNRSDGATHNNTGFNFRKFMDYTAAAFTRGIGSDMWFPRMRYSEVLLIASEAAMELGQQGDAKKYINLVRARAGIQELTADITLSDIEQERRVELAFENHRWWDLKRWRRAHVIWKAEAAFTLTDDVTTHNESAASDANTSGKFGLFPYKVKGADVPEHEGKYVYDKVNTADFTFSGGWLTFPLRNYYNFLDGDWLNRNPKLIRNPYQ